MSSPLSLLSLVRSAVMSGVSPLSVDGDQAVIGSAVFPRKQRTAWKGRRGETLELDALLFFLSHSQLRLSDYVKVCTAANVQLIPFGERKPLLDFLHGLADSSAFIDHSNSAGEQQPATAAAAADQRQQSSDAAAASAQAPPRPDNSSSSRSSAAASAFAAQPSTALKLQSVPEAGSASVSAAGVAPSSAASSSLPVSSSAAFSAGDQPSLPTRVADWSLADVLRCELTRVNRISCLQAAVDLSAVLDSWTQHRSRVKQRSRALQQQQHSQRKRLKGERVSSGAAGGSSSTGAALTGPMSAASLSASPSAAAGLPLIVLPSSLSSTLTLFNCRAFLEDGLLVPTEQAREQQPQPQLRPAAVRISRPSALDRSRTAQFECVDDVSGLQAEGWQRVVAVFASGASWQFDSAPNPPFSSPAAIFSAIPAFHLSYSDEQPNRNLQQWQLHRLVAHRSRHHNDRSLQMEFWQRVEDFWQSRPQRRMRI